MDWSSQIMEEGESMRYGDEGTRSCPGSAAHVSGLKHTVKAGFYCVVFSRPVGHQWFSLTGRTETWLLMTEIFMVDIWNIKQADFCNKAVDLLYPELKNDIAANDFFFFWMIMLPFCAHLHSIELLWFICVIWLVCACLSLSVCMCVCLHMNLIWHSSVGVQ